MFERKQDSWAIRRDGGGAHRAPKKAHLADDRMRHHAPHSQSFPVAACDFNIQMPGGDEIERICGLTFSIEDLRGIDVFSFEITDQIGGVNAWAELALEPRLKARVSQFTSTFASESSRSSHHASATLRSAKALCGLLPPKKPARSSAAWFAGDSEQ